MLAEIILLIIGTGVTFGLGYLSGWEARDRECVPKIPDMIALSGRNPPNCS